MTYKAVLFDLDGTLLNTLDDLTDSCNWALAQMGCPPRTANEVRDFVGNGVNKLIERALPDGASTEDIARCLALFRPYYVDHMEEKTAPYPGVMALLQALKARGVKVGVVSNKVDAAVKPLCRKYFGEWVDEAVGELEGVKRKPAPDAVHHALKALGVTPEHALYVGDSDVDVHTAKNARLPLIAVTWGFRPRECLIEAGASHVIDRADQFLAVMEQMEKE